MLVVGNPQQHGHTHQSLCARASPGVCVLAFDAEATRGQFELSDELLLDIDGAPSRKQGTDHKLRGVGCVSGTVFE